MNRNIGYERPLCYPWLYDFALHTFVKGVNAAAGGLTIEGDKNLTGSSNTILAGAHRHGIVDACVLAQTVDKLTDHKKIFFMSKKENFNHRFIGELLHGVGIFPVDRESKTPIWQQTDLTRHIGRIFNERGILGIFPEGTRRSGDRINKRDIKIGAPALALYFGGDIIPAGLGGTEKPRFGGSLSVVLEEPIHVEPVLNEDLLTMGLRDFVAQCKPIMQELYEKLNEAQFQAAQLVKANV